MRPLNKAAGEPVTPATSGPFSLLPSFALHGQAELADGSNIQHLPFTSNAGQPCAAVVTL